MRWGQTVNSRDSPQTPATVSKRAPSPAESPVSWQGWLWEARGGGGEGQMGFRGQQEPGLLRGHAEHLGLCSEHWEFTEAFEARRL